MADCPHIHLARVGSTLSEAWRLQGQGQAIPFWLTADEQTQGRGRLDRQWVSKPGNLYATHVTALPAHGGLGLLPFAVSLAVFQAIGDSLPEAVRPRLGLKWPNDVLIGDAKTSGILIERRMPVADDALVAIGIGINVAHAPAIAGRATTSLADEGAEATPHGVFEALRTALAIRLHQLAEAPHSLVPAWTQRAIGIGAALKVDSGAETLEGTFDHLASDGALMLRLSSGAMRAIRTGDIAIKPQLGQADAPPTAATHEKEPQ